MELNPQGVPGLSDPDDGFLEQFMEHYAEGTGPFDRSEDGGSGSAQVAPAVEKGTARPTTGFTWQEAAPDGSGRGRLIADYEQH